MARQRNQIVSLHMTPEEAYCIQEVLNVKSAMLSESLKDFARGGDADKLDKAMVLMTDLNQCEALTARLHGQTNAALQREADGEDADWIEQYFNDRLN
tara:strand:- start:9815 stop:10108 length:294 start_codon:yes stop_codon:yes gene_type:complete